MKRCSTCRETKPLSDFYRLKSSKDGRFNSCKSCSKEVTDRVRANRIAEKILSTSATCTTCDKPWPLGPSGRRRKCSECAHRTWVAGRVARGLSVSSSKSHPIPSTSENAALLEILRSQPQVCGICGKTEDEEKQKIGRRLAVDHDHESGVIRGLLCRQCNIGLGMLGDSLERIENAALYLRARR